MNEMPSVILPIDYVCSPAMYLTLVTVNNTCNTTDHNMW